MEEVDKTIDAICTWIQGELEQTCSASASMALPEMTKALAELVSARTNAVYEN